MNHGAAPMGLEETVWYRWQLHAERHPEREAIIHLEAGEVPYRWRWTALIAAARDVAERLIAEGIGPGEVCGIIIRHHRYFYPIYMGVCAMGALPAVLAYPNSRLHPEKFREGLEGMSRKSGLDWVLTDRQLEAVIAPLVTRPGSTIRGLRFPLDWESAAAMPASGRVGRHFTRTCLLQHSSGTTGLQKAVILSHPAILEHVRAYAEAIRLTDRDRVVSWLPLYHDMGLIAAFYLPLTCGIPLVQLNPFEWIGAPVLLLEAIAAERGTLAWLPNFAYNFMVNRVHEENLDGLRLDSLRLLINCSEMVRAESHERFLDRFGRCGLKPEALAACYAMAENTFAATQTPPGRAARIISVDRHAAARGSIEFQERPEMARRCVSSGVPIDGCELRIIDESGVEIIIRSRSLFGGYRNDPARTGAVLRHGWYHTGDIGFLHENEYYIIGRKNDLIIVAGKNLSPEDIEDIVSLMPGVVPGRAAAFGVEDPALGTDLVCVVAETGFQLEAELRQLRLEIKRAVMQIDVTLSRVYLVPPRWLIKSSAGKISRKANRERVLTEYPAGE